MEETPQAILCAVRMAYKRVLGLIGVGRSWYPFCAHGGFPVLSDPGEIIMHHVLMGGNVRTLLAFARGVDRLSGWIGHLIYWLILALVLISSSNAVVRKVFDISSNAFLEIQWYLFSAVFLLGAGYTLSRNAHVRVDVISARFSPQTRAWIDILGTVFFLLPVTGLVMYLAWPFFMTSWLEGEISSDAGGLVRWPVKLLLPIGFALLFLQGLAEICKRLAFLNGLISDPFDHDVIAAEDQP